MAKGDAAKSAVVDTIAKAFGEDFVGYIDKKIYVWSKENGQKVQVALSLTCPKTAVVGGTVSAQAGSADEEFSNLPTAVKTEISQEEQDNIANLLAQLGL